MCESKVFLEQQGERREIMDNVVALRPEGSGFLVRNLFGEEKHVEAKLGEIQLIEHRIVLVADDAAGAKD